MNSRDTRHLQQLETILARRTPQLLVVAARVGKGPITSDERQAMREMVADELVDHGLRPDDEPTPYGLGLEEIITWLGHP